MANPNWKKGKSGNPHGRGKGSKNKETEIKQALKDFYRINCQMCLSTLHPYQIEIN
jgi:hypothetical protein